MVGACRLGQVFQSTDKSPRPPLSAPIRKLILDELVAFLETPLSPDDLPIADWRLQEHARRRGRVHGAGKGKDKADAAAAGGEKAAPASGPSETQTSHKDKTAEPAPPGKTHAVTLRSNRTVEVPDYVDKPRTKRVPPRAPLPRPQLLNHLSVGINEVTKALEARIRWGRWELGDPSAAPGGGAVASAAASDPPAPAPAAKRRRTHSKHPTALPPLDPLHPVANETLQRASYRFLAHALPKPTTRLPPYLLPPSEEKPFFRVLANEHSIKLRKEKVKDTKLRASQLALKKRDIQLALLGDVIQADHSKFERATLAQTVKDDSSGKRTGKQPAKTAGATTEAGAKVTGAKEATATPSAAAQTPLEAVSVNGAALAGSKALDADEDVDEPDWVSMIDIIFVCKPDINPPSLVEHLPNMVGAANAVMEATQGALDLAETPAASTSNMDVDPASDDDGGSSDTPRPAPHGVYLVQLDLGAELKLGDVLALRRVAALGLSVSLLFSRLKVPS